MTDIKCNHFEGQLAENISIFFVIIEDMTESNDTLSNFQILNHFYFRESLI